MLYQLSYRLLEWGRDARRACNRQITIGRFTVPQLVARPGEPIAGQVIFAAKKAIFSGKLRPGDPFPSVRALGRAMKIHANTAQKVISQLAAEGFLDVLPGIGTVVAQRAAQLPGRRNGRAHLLARDVEQLAVQAMQIGISLGRTAVRDWRFLAPARGKGWSMIRTQQLTERYRHNEALHDLTLDVPQGSVFALADPNGAGKSTRLGAKELARIGYVSENQKLPEWMRCLRRTPALNGKCR